MTGLELLGELAARQCLPLRISCFFFLRHGETSGNHQRLHQPADQCLNDAGLAQTRQAAALLRAQPIERILASDLRRAWQTAAIVAQAVGIPATTSVGLRERSFGDQVGTSSAGIDWSADPPNGEPLCDFVERTVAGLTSALDSSETTLLVAHSGTLYVLASALRARLGRNDFANAIPLRFFRKDGSWQARPLDESRSRGDDIMPHRQPPPAG